MKSPLKNTEPLKKGRKKSKLKLSPRTYKQFGYDHYYKKGKRYFYTIDDEETGDEIIYDSKGRKIGQFN